MPCVLGHAEDSRHGSATRARLRSRVSLGRSESNFLEAPSSWFNLWAQLSKAQTLGNPAVMNTESSQLRIEDDFNTCSLCDTFHDNGDESTCNPPLPTSPFSSLPIWTIHPLAVWASVSQGTTSWLEIYNKVRCGDKIIFRARDMFAGVAGITMALVGRDSPVQIATGDCSLQNQWLLMIPPSVFNN